MFDVPLIKTIRPKLKAKNASSDHLGVSQSENNNENKKPDIIHKTVDGDEKCIKRDDINYCTTCVTQIQRLQQKVESLEKNADLDRRKCKWILDKFLHEIEVKESLLQEQAEVILKNNVELQIRESILVHKFINLRNYLKQLEFKKEEIAAKEERLKSKILTLELKEAIIMYKEECLNSNFWSLMKY